MGRVGVLAIVPGWITGELIHYPNRQQVRFWRIEITHESGPDIAIRNFSWADVPALYELMERDGVAPFSFADDPVESFRLALKQPRLNAEKDIVLADSDGQLVGWARVDLEPGLSRAVVQCGTDPDAPGITLRPRLVRAAYEIAKTANATVFHMSVDADDDISRMAAGSRGLRPVRVYQQLEYHPAPSYLRGDFRPLPDGYSIRTLDGVGEAAVLRELQNICFSGMWGYAPNNDEDIAASLGLPGQGPENVLLLGQDGQPPEAYVWMQLAPSAGMTVGVIGMLGVHPVARGKGFGAVIGTAGIRNLRGRAAGVVKLEVDKENTPAKRIYRDLGFQERSESVWYELRIGSGDSDGITKG